MSVSPPRRFVFWTKFLSHHQAPWIQQLRDDLGFTVEHGVDLSAEQTSRVGHGWPNMDGTMPMHIAPSQEQIHQLVTDQMDNTLHIITGGFSYPTARAALKACLKTGANFGIMAEPPYPYAKYYQLRKLAQRLFAVTRGQKVKAIWAIGKMCVDFYESVGYPSGKVIEWAYFPAVPDSALPEKTPRSQPVVLFASMFDPRKGPDTLIEAIKKVSAPCTLKMIGGGELEEQLRNNAPKNVTFEPFKPHAEAMLEIAQSDLVVVPSRYDGYGAVVNEALGHGIPVVCTDKCGSQILLRDQQRGAVAEAGNPDSLARAIQTCLENVKPCQQAQISAWARDSISPTVAARHFAQTVDDIYAGRSPSAPPWA